MRTIEHTVTLGPMPATVEEFIALRDRVARTPEGGAAMFALALLCYARDPAAGLAYVTVSTVAKLLDDDPAGYKGKRPRLALVQALRERIAAKPYIARSYVQGATPENEYAIALGATLVMLVREQADSLQGADRARVFVHSSGADSPRPVHLERNDKGLWKASSWSSLEVSVRAPVRASSDDL